MRRYILSDSDQPEAVKALGLHLPGIGESFIDLPSVSGEAASGGLAEIQSRLDEQTGRTGEFADRYVCLDSSGVVTQVFIGDPACGDCEGHQCVANLTARVGARWDGMNWHRSIEEIDNDLNNARRTRIRATNRATTRDDGEPWVPTTEEFIEQLDIDIGTLEQERAVIIGGL